MSVGPPSPVVFLLDVDDTLLDNDRVAADLERFLVREVGPNGRRGTGRSSLLRFDLPTLLGAGRARKAP
jgi:hypothetical protein